MEYPAPGTLIHNRYEVIDTLSEGGTALAIKGIDRKTRQLTVVKRYKPGVMSPPFEKRIFYEPRLPLKSKDYIVQSHDAFKSEGFVHSAQRFVEGNPLINILMENEGPVVDRHAIYTVLCVTKAVEGMHQAGVIASDVKPDNIIIDIENRPTLIDLASFEQPYAKPEISMGTFPYSPSELLNKDTLYPSTDVYSLGILWFEMIVGEKDFAPLAETWRSNVERYISPDISLIRNISPQAWKILKKALDADPTKRFKDASSFYQAVFRLYQGEERSSASKVLTLLFDKGKRLRIQPGRTVMGRKLLAPKNVYISEKQFEIQFDGKKSSIKAILSVNPTQLNRQDLIPGQKIMLQKGDVIEVPNLSIRVEG